MKIEILATGDEVLEGLIVDTNTAYMAQELKLLGYTASRFNAVKDDLQALAEMILEISERADLCLMTGGMGPTSDDLTLDALALAKKVDLEMDWALWERIKEKFILRSMEAPISNQRQARVPVSGEALFNEVGTAPAMKIQINRCTFFAFPGVPSEMKWLLNHYFLPWLEQQNHQKLHRKILRFCLIAESELYDRILPLNLPTDLRIGYQALGTEHRVKLACHDLKILEESCEKIKQVALAHYSNDLDMDLATAVVKTAIAQNKTLAFAESCTGGAVSAAIASVAGASSIFKGGVVSYSYEAKEKVLGVSHELLSQDGAFNTTCASQMVTGLGKQFEVDWAVSVTGIAGPQGGNENNPVGSIYFGWLHQGQVETEKVIFSGSRHKIQNATVAYILIKLLQKLNGLPELKLERF
jgi:nicotinamide-nucleotide amidase